MPYNATPFHPICNIFKLMIGYKKVYFKASNKVTFHVRHHLMQLKTLFKFIIKFFLISCTVFEIGTLASQFAAKWHCKRALPVEHNHFIIYRHYVYDCIPAVILKLMVSGQKYSGHLFCYSGCVLFKKNNINNSVTGLDLITTLICYQKDRIY